LIQYRIIGTARWCSEVTRMWCDTHRQARRGRWLRSSRRVECRIPPPQRRAHAGRGGRRPLRCDVARYAACLIRSVHQSRQHRRHHPADWGDRIQLHDDGRDWLVDWNDLTRSGAEPVQQERWPGRRTAQGTGGDESRRLGRQVSCVNPKSDGAGAPAGEFVERPNE
jgi:hypothetical protein